ncbi:MAG: condensation domain-containing protein [Gammaproteobacteria bacterium]|nr:condensation domain-containing protein [Gammaproteobacteria bacterium]
MYFNSQNFKLDKEYFTNISNQCSLIETNENIIFSSEEIEVDLTKYNLLLNECAKKIGCTVYAILLTSFIFVMQEIFQNKNICIGLPITMRTDSFFENMIGPFNTRLPFFYSYNDKISFLDNCNYCFAALKELRSHVFFPHNELTKIKPKWYSIVFDMESLIEIVDSIIIQQLPIPDNNVMSHHVFARVHKSKDSMKLNFRCRLDLVSQNKRSDIVEKYISVMHVFLEDYLGR